MGVGVPVVFQHTLKLKGRIKIENRVWIIDSLLCLDKPYESIIMPKLIDFGCFMVCESRQIEWRTLNILGQKVSKTTTGEMPWPFLGNILKR